MTKQECALAYAIHRSGLLEKLTDLGWDYQSMTRSGQQTYDEIMQIIGVLKPNEKWIDL